MGYSFVTAAKSLIANTGQEIKLTSVICSPISNTAVSAEVTLFNATAATANTEVLKLKCGSTAQTVVWNDFHGINIKDNLYVNAASAYVTVVWD